MRQTNAAFLTKLGWRLMVEKDKLWSQVLIAKYCNGRCDVDMFQPKMDASNAYRGILENAKFLKKGMRTEIGNGFWDHNWVDSKPLCQDALKDIPIHIQDTIVAEMWHTHAGLKWNLIVDILPETTLKKITAFEVFPGDMTTRINLFGIAQLMVVFPLILSWLLFETASKTHRTQAVS